MDIDRLIAGEDTDILVGKALGYTVYHYSKGHASSNYFMLLDENGDPVVPGREGERKTEDEAWDDAPHWSTFLPKALTLLDKFEYIIERTFDYVRVDIKTEKGLVSGKGDHNELALAICKAWLKIDFEALKKHKRLQQIEAEISLLQKERESLLEGVKS